MFDPLVGSCTSPSDNYCGGTIGKCCPRMLIRKNSGSCFLDGIRGCCEHVLRRSIDSPFFLGGGQDVVALSGCRCCWSLVSRVQSPGFDQILGKRPAVPTDIWQILIGENLQFYGLSWTLTNRNWIIQKEINNEQRMLIKKINNENRELSHMNIWHGETL